MVITSLLACLPLLTGVDRSRLDGEPFVELFSTPLVGDPAEEVLYVFADEGPDGDELHVLSHRRTLGVFRVEATQVIPVANQHVQLPAALPSGTTWVFSRGSIGAAAFAQGVTTYQPFSPAGLAVTRSGAWGVLASEDGSALFFVRGGTDIEAPAELAVVDEDGERLVLRTLMLPRIQASRNADVFVVQAGKNDLHRISGGPPTPLPPGGTLHIQPEGRWLVHERASEVELRRLADNQIVPLPPSIAPSLVAVKFQGDYVLLVARTRAELFDLGSSHPGQALFEVDAIDGHRFASAALYRRGVDGVPWIALGELAVRVPQMVLPNSPEPLASAVVRAVDRVGVTAERWSIEVTAWRGNTPFVQWSREGRLIASTKDRVLVSERLYP